MSPDWLSRLHVRDENLRCNKGSEGFEAYDIRNTEGKPPNIEGEPPEHEGLAIERVRWPTLHVSHRICKVTYPPTRAFHCCRGFERQRWRPVKERTARLASLTDSMIGWWPVMDRQRSANAVIKPRSYVRRNQVCNTAFQCFARRIIVSTPFCADPTLGFLIRKAYLARVLMCCLLTCFFLELCRRQCPWHRCGTCKAEGHACECLGHVPAGVAELLFQQGQDWLTPVFFRRLPKFEKSFTSNSSVLLSPRWLQSSSSWFLSLTRRTLGALVLASSPPCLLLLLCSGASSPHTRSACTNARLFKINNSAACWLPPLDLEIFVQTNQAKRFGACM